MEISIVRNHKLLFLLLAQQFQTLQTKLRCSAPKHAGGDFYVEMEPQKHRLMVCK